MTTAINIRFNGESNMGIVHKDIAKLRAEFQLVQKAAMDAAVASGRGIGGYTAMQNQFGELRNSFARATNAAGEYQILQQKLVPQSVSYAEAIKQQKVGLVEAVKNHSIMNKVLREQIALQHSSTLAWSKDAQGRISSDLIVPKSVPTELMNARAHMGLYNKLISSVSQNTINWGKNTQWAGRQLMTGLTLPVTMLGAVTAKLAYDMEKQLTKVLKVYGDVTTGLVENNETVKENAMNTVKAAASVYGQSAKNTLGIMADLAAAGKTGIELQQATLAASKASVLGELEYQAAAQATITLQNVYHHSAKQIGEDFDYINAMENQTVLTSKDFTTAIPKISGVMNALGGDLRDVGTLLTAFKGAGIDAAEGANALKTINFRLVATYGKGLATFQANTGKDLSAIVKETGGKTIPTLMKFAEAIKDLSAPKKVQVVRDVFGIYQGSKALLLLEQLTTQTDQLSQAMAVGNNSVAENAQVAAQELQRLNDSAPMKIQKAIAQMNISLSEVGAKVLPVLADVVEGVVKIVDSFKEMSNAKKATLAIVVGLVAIAGPIIMLVGLFANLAGNIGKTLTSLGSLLFRFKIIDAAQQTRILHGKAAAETMALEASAQDKMAVSLDKLVKEMEAAATARARLNMVMSPAMKGYTKPLPLPSAAPTDVTAGGLYSRDASGKIRIAKGQPGAGSFIKEEKALALEKARTIELDKQALLLARAERSKYRVVVVAEKQAALDKIATKQAAEKLAIDNNILAAKEKQARFTGAVLGGGAFSAGMITSMVAGSDTLIGKLGSIAMMLGMLQMMMPKVFSAMIGGLGTLGTRIDTIFKGKISAGAAVAKNGFAKILPAIGAIAPYLAVAGTALFVFWKIANDQSEKARASMENYGKATQTVADILGFAYQEQARTEGNTPDAIDKRARSNADKFIAANKDAADEMQRFMNKTGIVTGEMWGEAIAQGAKVKLHGGSAQAAEDASFMVLKIMGAKISAEEFKATIKAKIDFEDADATLATQIGLIQSGIEKATRHATGIEGFMQSNGEISQAGAEAAKTAANDFYTAWNATQKENRPKFMETAVNTLNEPYVAAFEKVPDAMKKAGISGGAELSSTLSKFINVEQKRSFLMNLGLTREETSDILHQAEALRQVSQELAIKQGLVKEGEAGGIVRPEDVLNLLKLRDTTDASGKAYISAGQASKDYKKTLDAAAKAGYHISDATKLVLLNMNRLRVSGLKPTNNLLDEFGDVTISAAENAEILANKLKTNIGVLEEYGYGAQMSGERALAGMATVRGAQMEGISSAVTDAINKEGENAVAATTASGKAMSDALDARIKASEKVDTAAADKLKNRREAEKKAITTMYDARINKVKDAIKAETDAENTRQKIFEAEKTRIQRLAEMYNKNIDLNMAINSGNLDEAAKIQNDMSATQQGWATGDAADASKTASEKKLTGLNLELDNINKAKDARLDALAVTQDAEDKALKSSKDRIKDKFDAEKKALDASNAAAVKDAQSRVDMNKKLYETQLANLMAFTPRNDAEQKKQIADIQALYKQYGNGTLIPQGKAWSNIVGSSLKNAVIREGNKIKSEVPWEEIGSAVSVGIMKGAFGMTPAEFTKWLGGGIAPPGSPFGEKVTRSNKSIENQARMQGGHKGGVIDGSPGDVTGYSRSSPLGRDEVMLRALKGEGVLSRQGMAGIGAQGLKALNSGLPMGGADLTGGFGIAGVPMAMVAGAAKGMIRATLAAVGRKRVEQDLGVNFTALGAGAGNSQKVYNTLTSLGFTPQAAAGVIGNLMQESGVNPNSMQANGPGRGIMQWTENERWAGLKKWAGKRDPWALNTQVQFMLKEMNDYGLTDRYKGMTNVNEATDLFEQVMERAGTPNMSARYRYAQSALKSFGKGQQPGTANESLFGQNINLPNMMGGPAHERLINFGRKLKGLGFNVGENNAFGGVSPRPTHSANSWHYRDGAIDVNFDGRGQGYEDSKINGILALAKQYKLRTIWQYPGHYDHAHFDESTGPDLGNFGIGGTGLEQLGKRAGMGMQPEEDIMDRGSFGQRVVPVRGKVSSRFGLRDNPLLGRKTYHDGTDIVAPQGTPIHSFAGGRVLFAGVDKALGNYTVVQHSNGMLSGYGHQSKQNVGVGDMVKAGQVIGQVGSTGDSTGPHLHFQTGTPGKWFDPNMVMPQLKTGGYTLNDGYARLHKAETVLTAPLSKQLNDGIDRFANGPTTSYTIKADFNGATFASDVDVERAFQNLMDKAERRNGSNRKVGNK